MALVGNSARIEEAVLYQLSQLTLDPARVVVAPDELFEGTQGEIHLETSILWNQTDRAEIGTGSPNRHMGILQIGVKGPFGKGISSTPQIEVADALIAYFDRATFSRNSVTVRIGSFTGGNSVPWRSGAFIDGAWRLIPVSIPFWCDVFPA